MHFENNQKSTMRRSNQYKIRLILMSLAFSLQPLAFPVRRLALTDDRASVSLKRPNESIA
jgi:hypothetical protein